MRADRLISLLMLLQTKKQMTAQALADRLEVSVRTIYRDLDALSAAGVPVYTERGPQGGCRLLESYRTNLTGLKEDEVRALFMFTVPGLLADLGAEKASEAATLKLTAALPAPFQKDIERIQQRLYLDPTSWFQAIEPVPHLRTIQAGVWQEQRLRMTYRRSDGHWVKRLVEPLGLVAKAGTWYMVSYMPSRAMKQVYRVGRVQTAELTETHFTRPANFDLAAYWQSWCQHFEQGRNRYDVTILVTPTGVPLLVQTFGDGLYTLMETAIEENGRLCLTLSFASAEDACRQLLGLGPDIEVKTPLALREKMAQTAVKLFSLYNKVPTHRD